MASRTSLFLVTLVLAIGCSDKTPPETATPDAARSDSANRSDASRDTSSDEGVAQRDFHQPEQPDRATACPVAPPVPTQVLLPEVGELYYEQVGLGGFATGESAIVVGADQTAVLIDVGNDSHADVVVDRVNALGIASISAVVVTHYHADHGDGLAEVLRDLTLSGPIVSRGFVDITDAANASTAAEVRDQAAATGALDLCDQTSCPNLGQTIDAGETRIVFIAANATIATERYEDLVGPLLTDDNNGENARSVVGTIVHGPFVLLFAGDLTGGGSDTDDVESFFAPRLPIGVLGVDVMHASHHGRNTSTNATWVDRVLPDDGRSRNVVVGISAAHLGSPHTEVLDNLQGRLVDGSAWTTGIARGGESAPFLESADGGRIVVRTFNGGQHYAVQSISSQDAVLSTSLFSSVAGCD